jgi:hypothetical protein
VGSAVDVDGSVIPPTANVAIHIEVTGLGPGFPPNTRTADVTTAADGTFAATIDFPGQYFMSYSVTTTAVGATGIAQCTTDCPPPAVSDIRLKTDITSIGVSSSGLKLYKFRYKDDPYRQFYVGVMAQDLVDSHPYALEKDARGYYLVRYDLLDLKMAYFSDWKKYGLRSVEGSLRDPENIEKKSFFMPLSVVPAV